MNLKQSKTLSALLICALISTVSTPSAHADCKEAYSNAIKKLDGMLNPARTTLAATGATAIAVPVTMAALGVAIAPAAVVGAPAAVAGAALFYGIVEGMKHSYMKSLQLFKNVEKGSGKWLTKTTQRIQKHNPDVSEADVIAAVKSANLSNEFCQENENGKVKVFLYSKVRKMIAAKIATASAEEALDAEEVSAEILTDEDL